MSRERARAEVVIFTCDKCGKIAKAGSEDLLQNWEKRGATEGKGEDGVWHHAWRADCCGDCK